MTGALSPELAVAYVRELSSEVSAVVVLDAGLAALAGPEAARAPARALAESLPSGSVRVPDGVAIVARGAGHTVVVAAGPLSLTGPTALDAAAAVAALTNAAPGPPPEPVADPSPVVAAAAAELVKAA